MQRSAQKSLHIFVKLAEMNKNVLTAADFNVIMKPEVQNIGTPILIFGIIRAISFNQIKSDIRLPELGRAADCGPKLIKDDETFPESVINRL